MRDPDFSRYAGKVFVLPALSVVALSAVLATAPVVATHAQSTTDGSVPTSPSHVTQRESRAETSAETIDQRIASLHQELQITPAEEADWKTVAQTMQDNADAMAKLASEKEAQSSSNMTAIQDLETYSEFAQAHVDHLRKLTSAFKTLYNAMPDRQKKLADQVFAHSQHDQQSAGQKG